MRRLSVTAGGIIDSITGEVIPDLGRGLEQGEGLGAVVGYSLFPLIARLLPLETYDSRYNLGEWSFYIHGHRKRVNPEKRISGAYFFTRACCTFYHSGGGRNSEQSPSIKWVFWNLEQFFPNGPELDPIEAGERLERLCEDRGINAKPTPGAMGAGMLRASPEYGGRYPAPFFISEIAREHLPGNYYADRKGFDRTLDALLLDQKAAHHNIANSTPIPHPQSIHRRGYRSPGRAKVYLENLHLLRNHWGLLHCLVKCSTIPPTQLHLYPEWAQTPGESWEWVWTPELRLLDDRIEILGVRTALTGTRLDTALIEYSDFALDQIKDNPHPVVKAALHAAYGNLAVKAERTYEQIIVGRQRKSLRAEDVRVPLVKELGQRTTVERVRVPAIQNVIARGIIEAEQTTRSLELARQLEGEGFRVLKVYADAVIIEGLQTPLFLPKGWEVKAPLRNLVAGAPNQILAENIQRLPGFSGARRATIIQRRQVA